MSERSEVGEVSIDEAWEALVTTALLGTDRREPPEPPAGPIADVVADLDVVLGDSSPDARFLNQLAAIGIARRLASRPAPPAAALTPPTGEQRPLCSPAAVEQWWLLIDEWPVLEDEWLTTVLARGETVPGDVLVELLDRHRSDLRRHQLVQLVGGPVVAWVSDHLDWPTAPALPSTADAEALPALLMHPALAACLADDTGDQLGDELGDHVRELLTDPAFTAADRRLVEHVVARCMPERLDGLIDTLEAAAADGTSPAAAVVLADLARRRRTMLAGFAQSGAAG